MTAANYFKIAPVASHAAKLGHNMTLINMSFCSLPHLYFKDDLVTSFWVRSLLTVSMCKQKANASPKSSLVALSLKEPWISPRLLLHRLPLCSWFLWTVYRILSTCSPQLPIFPKLDECTLFGSSSNYAISIHYLFFPSPSLLVGNTWTEFHQVIAQKIACTIPGCPPLFIQLQTVFSLGENALCRLFPLL